MRRSILARPALLTPLRLAAALLISAVAHADEARPLLLALDKGEITYTVRGQDPKVLKAGEFVYIPRGTVHRNENKSNAPTRTLELMVRDKDAEQTVRAE